MNGFAGSVWCSHVLDDCWLYDRHPPVPLVVSAQRAADYLSHYYPIQCFSRGLINFTGCYRTSFFTVIFFPGCLFMLAHGINHSCAQSTVLKPFPGTSMQVADLNGCLMMVTTFIIASLLPDLDGAVAPILITIAGLMVFTGLL